MIFVSTRRALLGQAGATAAVSTLTALPPAGARAATTDVATAFVASIAALHPDGRTAALHALRSGMAPDDLVNIMLGHSKGPCLLFRNGESTSPRFRSFDVTGEF